MKKFATVSAALLLAAALTACGQATDSSSAAETSAAASSMAEETSAAAEETSAAAEESSEATGPQTANYTFKNSTGEKITELYHYVNGKEKGKNLAGEGLDKDATVDEEPVVLDAKETKDFVSTVEFVTESGRTGKFENLHFESVLVNLLSKDAMTGATPLEFQELPAAK